MFCCNNSVAGTSTNCCECNNGGCFDFIEDLVEFIVALAVLQSILGLICNNSLPCH